MKKTRVGCDVCARPVLLCAWFVILAVGMFCTPTVAMAGEADTTPAKTGKERLAEITIAVKAHKKAKSITGIQEELSKIETLYEDAADDDELRVKIVKFVGSLTRGSKNVSLATEMLHTLSDIGDPRGAKYVKPYLKQPDKKKAPEMLRIAVGVAADVRHDSLVGPLLSIVTQSKTFGVAGDAVDTLGRYRECKKLRNKIVDTLLRTTKKSKPGGRPRMRGSQPQDIDPSGSGGCPTGFRPVGR